jgi:hypothetical protein
MIDTEEIVKKIKNNEANYVVNKNLFDILEGQLLDKIDMALKDSYISNRAYNIARKQIAPINIINQMVSKLSKIYSTPVTRTAENPTDQELMDYYVNEMQFDSMMAEANRFYNGMKSSAVEPYLDESKPRLRVLPPHQFLPISTDIVSPTKMNEFVKYMGDDVFFVYSEDEFKAIDKEGKELPQYMIENEGENPFGILTQVYINKSKHMLIPHADKDLLQIGLIVNIKLANLMYAIQYQTNSIIYGIDLDISKLELNPDNFWSLYTTDDGKKPEIGMIKPEVNIVEVLSMLGQVTEQFLNSRNLRSNATSDVSSSGVALQIKNIDTTDDRKEQIVYFSSVEDRLWQTIKVMHNYWADAGLVEERRKFSEDFKPSITFASPKPIESQSEIVARNKELIDMGLITKSLAMNEIYPNKSQEEIDQLLKEIEDSNIIKVENIASETPEIQNIDRSEI